MIRPYSSSISPPVPVFDVVLSAPALDDWHGPFTAIIDSGADFTIIPLEFSYAPANPQIHARSINSGGEFRIQGPSSGRPRPAQFAPLTPQRPPNPPILGGTVDSPRIGGRGADWMPVP